MKIEKSSNPLPLASGGDVKTRAVTTNPADNTASTVASSTNVSLGTTSAQLGAGVASTPVNASKVAEIKQAISEGRFQVNASVVANSLIKSVTDLLSAQKA